MRVGAVSDLITFRRRRETFVRRVLEHPFDSVYGAGLRLVIYRNTMDGGEHAALMKGEIRADRPTVVRIHLVDLASDILGRDDERHDSARRAIQKVAVSEAGAVVFIRRSDAIWSERYAKGDGPPSGNPVRDYGVGAQILKDLGARDMELRMGTQAKMVALDGYGLKIVKRTRCCDVALAELISHRT